ncbi:MGMT family protein [Verrucomicrobiaceae bacterium N1E253]|uniref:MGMT family protein n=1 Tax=Oceaniferula marina TaxID=2748318 RepID=A0A851GMK0_9BACT|nr:MGMT family protein [Oceaniferula marina]NWK55344.1 MGMT family protein [Oceaniferula marina]
MAGDADRVTDFQRRVYAALERIPLGKVTTYRELARELGCGSAQAIGQALKRNPYAPDVPCHRVIRTDLSIGGYSGQTEGAKIEKKIRLLGEEGVPFDDSGRLVDPSCLFFYA